MHFELENDELRTLVRAVVAETLASCDWPPGRVSLTESEAAEACGVGRHVLRDLRLAGRVKARRLGRKIVYTRDDLLGALNGAADQRSGELMRGRLRTKP
jgi:DNA-binding FadR family transcriptional regulator